jgi:ParB-like chromosome segregation protein Spo0J
MDAVAATQADHGPEEPTEVNRFLALPTTGTQRVPVGAVRAGESPRLEGESAEHARALAESGATLPPILVHRRTMRVIDGMHRLRAVQLRGDETIDVQFFDGSDGDVFIVAVRANIAHGLPLTLADRESAAGRILTSHPQLSDRSIAQIAGLAAGTVRELRRRTASDGGPASAVRVGRDGRVRPLDSTEARRLASDVIAERPEASLREIARAAGLSPSTVRDVRERMRRGEDPVPDRRVANVAADADGRPRTVGNRRPPSGGGTRAGRGLELAGGGPDKDPAAVRRRLLENLSKDPSLRFADSGRDLLRALYARCFGPPGPELLASLPSHCSYTVAALAYACAQEWQDFAVRVEHRFETGVDVVAER